MTEEARYPWYEVANGAPILQGDLLDRCPVLVPKTDIVIDGEDDPILEAEILEYDVVVMSQSCDLEQENIDLVLVCPVWPYTRFSSNDDFYKSRKGKEALQRGNAPGYHLLRSCEIEGWSREAAVVDFRNVYGIPFNYLKQVFSTRSRLRLLPPYREHLSQAFARFFMRVGLPINVDIK